MKRIKLLLGLYLAVFASCHPPTDDISLGDLEPQGYQVIRDCTYDDLGGVMDFVLSQPSFNSGLPFSTTVAPTHWTAPVAIDLSTDEMCNGKGYANLFSWYGMNPVIPYYTYSWAGPSTIINRVDLINDFPIKRNGQAGDVITLCSGTNYFNSGQGVTANLAANGIYTLDAPGQKQVYFVLPAQPAFWGALDGTAGRNLWINYRISNIACDGVIVTGGQEYSVAKNGFANNIFGYGAEKFATTNFQALYDFWSDNVITVGIAASNTMTTAPPDIANTKVFDPSVPSTETPPAGITNNFVGELSIINGGYEITDRPTNQSMVPGSTIWIHVLANFGNEQIDQWKSVVLTNQSQLYMGLHSEIRGNLNTQTPVYNITFYKQ